LANYGDKKVFLKKGERVEVTFFVVGPKGLGKVFYFLFS
jgi:hypothetical protein